MALLSDFYEIPASFEHILRSSTVGDDFKIRVLLPSLPEYNAPLPVLYALDGDDFFDALGPIVRCLQLHGQACPFILVGIGYARHPASELLRQRDLQTHKIRELYADVIAQLAASPLSGGLSDLSILEKTDAYDFIAFIEHELKPFVQSEYRTNPLGDSLWGYSAGGSLALLALLNRPGLFANYIVGSPATALRESNYMIAEWALADASEPRPATRLYLSVGTDEDRTPGFEQFGLVAGVNRLATMIEERPLPGLSHAFVQLPGETHATAWMPSFYKGVAALLPGAAPSPVAPNYMSEG